MAYTLQQILAVYFKTKNISKYCILCFALTSFHPPSWAGNSQESIFDLSIEELLQITIKSSSFFDTSQRQSPGSVWSFTQQDLSNTPIIYVRDIFEFYVPSTTVSFTGLAGPKTGVRGIDTDNNAKTVFMLNGQNLNQKNHYGFQTGLQSVLFGDIDRVEVILGPGAILHGSGAINSIVNLVSKNGQDHQGTHTEITYGYKENLRKVETGYGKRFGNKKDVYMYAGFADAEGFSPSSYMEYSSNTRPASEAPNYPTYQLDKNLRLSTYINWHDFHIQTQYQTLEPGFNHYISSDIATENIDSSYWQKFWATRIEYNWYFNDHVRLEISSPIEFFDHGVKLSGDNQKKVGAQDHFALKNTLYMEGYSHKLAMGIGYGKRNFSAGKQHFSSDSPLSQEIIDADLSESEIFAEYTCQVSEKLSLLAGIRYDNVSYDNLGLTDANEVPEGIHFKADDISATSKRLALSYLFNSQKTIKLSYQEGFRYPDVGYFRYLGMINASLQQSGYDPLLNLEEETVKSLQLSYIYQFNDLPLSLDITSYYNRYENILDWARWPRNFFSSDEEYTAAYRGIPWNGIDDGETIEDYFVESYQNTDSEINSVGIELSSNWQPIDKFFIRTTYSFSRPTGIDKNSNTLVLLNAEKDTWASYPEHLFKSSLSHKINDHWQYNITAYYASNVDICNDEVCDEISSEVRDYHKKDRIRFNTKIQYFFNSKFHLALVGQNIFENDGAPVGAESRFGLATNGALGDDARRLYLSLTLSLD